MPPGAGEHGGALGEMDVTEREGKTKAGRKKGREKIPSVVIASHKTSAACTDICCEAQLEV
jgi:hypothetical protein